MNTATSRSYFDATTHPLADGIESGVLVSVTHGPVLSLTPSRGDLLLRATSAGLPLALITGDGTRLTEVMRSTLSAARGAPDGQGVRWVVRTVGGLRDGLDGRPLRRVQDAFNRRPTETPHPDALYLERPTTLQLVVSAAVRLQPDSVRLGGLAEAVARLGGAEAPAGWGPHEPAEHVWDRGALTAFARARAPRSTRLCVVGDHAHPLAGVITVQRTPEGVDESSELLVSAGVIGDSNATSAIAAVPGMLTTLANTSRPVSALVFTRPSRADLTTSSFVEPSPSPLAMLLGPSVVRELRLDLVRWRQRLDAEVIRRPRTPALLLRLRGPSDSIDAGWAALATVVDLLGPDGLKRLGVAGLDTSTWPAP